MDERRKFKRVPIDTALICQFPNQDNIKKFGFQEITNPKSVNISMGGLQIQSDDELPLNLYLLVYFYITDATPAVKIKGKVVWCEKNSNKEYKVGIEFSDISDHNKKLLRDFFGSASH